ncbi:hypothetical protein [Virgibacillus sediminis]|uniref:Bacterial spore germination immunoglobulin-like domain-containing protein n=1 Tax=Virgibacillus sediminis TaxID=202260 RepID=A0ABV7AA22_9BACI
MRYILIILAAAAVLAGCSGTVDDKENETAEQGNTAVSLRNIDVITTGNEIQLTAEASTAQEELFYKLEQGEETLIEESSFTPGEGEGEWRKFQLNIGMPDELDSSGKAPIITIYAKDEQGEPVNPNYIPVDMNMDE